MVKPAGVSILLVGVIYLVVQSFLSVTPVVLVVMFGVFALLYGLSVLRFGGVEEEVMIVNSAEERFEVDLEPVKRVMRFFME